MRLFLIAWDGGFPELADVASELQKRSHEIVYWTRTNDFAVDKSVFSRTIFHDHDAALAGQPAEGVDVSDFLPPDEEMIKRFLETESTVMTMMNKKYEWMEINERRHFYYNLLQYWRGVLNKYKPDAIIFGVIPHSVYDFVIFSLALEMKIKVISFESVWLHDRVLTMNNYKIGPARLLEELARSKDQNFSVADLSEDIKEYYLRQTDRASDTTPGYVNMVFKTYSGWNKWALKWRALIWSIKDGTFFEKLIQSIKKSRDNMMTEYLNLQVAPDLNKKYLYVPLHVQPERTTSPQGGVFVDQLLMIQTLSAALPADWIIYVKEHPTQWVIRGKGFFSYRYRGIYTTMAALKNVKLVPNNFNSYALIGGAQAVATIGGTASWEAVLRGKPALVFGYPWFQQAPGIFKVNGVESCRAAFKKIIDGYKVDEQAILNYVAAVDRTGFHAYTEPFGREISKISPRENTMNMLGAILAELG